MNETTHYRLAIVIATLKAYLAVWFFVVALVLGAYIMEISSPMMGDISWQEAGRFGSSFFLSALGGRIVLGGVAFGLIPLSLSMLLAALLYFSLRCEGLASFGEYLSCVVASLLVTFFAWLSSLPSTPLFPSLVGATVLSGLVAGVVWYKYVHSHEGELGDQVADVSVEAPPRGRKSRGLRAGALGARAPEQRGIETELAAGVSLEEGADGRELLNFLRHGGKLLPTESVENSGAHVGVDDAPSSHANESAHVGLSEKPTASRSARNVDSDQREGISIRGVAKLLLIYACKGWCLVGPLGAALALVLSVGVVVHIVMRWSEVISLASYYEMSLLEHCGFALLQLAFAPTVLVYAAAYATGAGFSLGTGITFSALGNHLGPLPAIPVLGALPQAHVRASWIIAVIVAISCGIGLWRGWNRPLGKRFLAWIVALVELFALASLSARLASGSLGEGALAFWGVDPLRFALVVLLECGGGLALGLFVFNPATVRGAAQTCAHMWQALVKRRWEGKSQARPELDARELAEGDPGQDLPAVMSPPREDKVGEDNTGEGTQG